jgi:hypothetical protein
MKKKNPAIAAVLNFFLPGWGFVYLGSPIMIVTGVALFVCVVLSIIADLNSTGSNETLSTVSGIGILLTWAAISWEVTNIFNSAAQNKVTAPGGEAAPGRE